MMRITFHGKILLALVVLSFLLRLILITQNIETILSKFMTDDSYYAYDIAYNVATGKGITFNDNVPTNGFTVLYTLGVLPPLMKIFLPLGINAPIYASLIVLSLFTIGTGILVYLICSHILNKTAGLFAAFIWLFNPYVIFVSLIGLETPTQIFLLALLTWLIIKKTNLNFSIKESIIVGSLVGLIFLARMDSVFVGIGLIIVLIIRKLLNGKSMLNIFKQKDLYIIAIVSLLVVSPWLAWSYVNVGRLTPHSGEAGEIIDKIRYIDTVDLTYADSRLNVLHSFAGFITKFFFLIADSRLLGGIIISVFLFLPTIYLLLRRDKLYKILLKLDFLLLSTTLYYLYYIYRATGLRDWYSLQTSFVVSLLFSFIVIQIASRFKKPNIFILSITTVLMVGFIYSGIIYFERGNCPLCLGTYEIAQYVNTNISLADTIGAFGAGVLQYYTPYHDVINLDGVVNPHALKALKEDNLDKFALDNNITYVVETRIPWFYKVLFNKTTIKYEESPEDFITKYDSYKKEDSGIFIYKIFKIGPA